MRAGILIVLGVLFSTTLLLPSLDASGINVADLKDQLKNGLRVRRPADLARDGEHRYRVHHGSGESCDEVCGARP